VASQIPESGKDPCSADLHLSIFESLERCEREITKRAGAQKIESEREIGISAMGGVRMQKVASVLLLLALLLPPSPVPCPHAADTTLPEISGYRTFLTWGWQDSVLPD
jgi:hypothetical protein